jgi:hypothetical protein
MVKYIFIRNVFFLIDWMSISATVNLFANYSFKNLEKVLRKSDQIIKESIQYSLRHN